jgi:large subunit ribosomal protein L21
MYAIVEIAGQQFKVVKDQKVFVHRLQTEEGKQVAFDNVLLLGDGDKVTIGAPAIGGAQVGAKVLKHLKGDKVIVFKKKRRKGYRVKNGHRQSLTEILIESIVTSGAKPASAKATADKPKATAPKVEAKKATPKVEAKPVAKPASAKATAGKKEEATQDLSKMTVAQLKEMAKSKGITGISSMKKADLIAALS